MYRRTLLASITAVLVLSVMSLGSRSVQVAALDGTPSASEVAQSDDFAVTVEITGVVQSIVQQSVSVYLITLEDGTNIKVNPATQTTITVQPGALITITAVLEDNEIVAKIIIAALPATEEPTQEATLPATQPPTPPATPPATLTADCGGNPAHPVATRLAAAFGVPYSEIMGWHCKGYGFGEIARAYLLAKLSKNSQSPLTVEQIFAMRAEGQGWGNIVKTVGVHPSNLAPGQIMKGFKGKIKGKGGEIEIEIEVEGQPPQTITINDDNGNGHDKGDENGKGKDKDKDKGKGNDDKGGNGKNKNKSVTGETD